MPPDPAETDRHDRIRLLHMVESSRRARRYAEGHSAATLAADEMRLLAIVESIEVIGEASTKESARWRSRLPGIDWRGIKLMRNRLIHGYDTVDAARVLDAVEIDIPPLIGQIEAALRQWPGEPSI